MCLSGVRGQVQLLGGAALARWVHHHPVAREACQASESVFLTRQGPGHSERGGANGRELEVGGG